MTAFIRRLFARRRVGYQQAPALANPRLLALHLAAADPRRTL